MRAVVQRVSRASVSWKDDEGRQQLEQIGRGLAVLIGAGPADDPSHADSLADKVAQLRIFPDADGRFNLSVEDIGGEALVVTQFTLYADTTRGRRPSFAGAAAPDCARALCQRFADHLAERGVVTRTGSFGARMTVSLDNDGPVTLALSTDPWETRIRA
jgi:D-tyrosyl-tRNA(Tyr) deacylase